MDMISVEMVRRMLWVLAEDPTASETIKHKIEQMILVLGE